MDRLIFFSLFSPGSFRYYKFFFFSKWGLMFTLSGLTAEVSVAVRERGRKVREEWGKQRVFSVGFCPPYSPRVWSCAPVPTKPAASQAIAVSFMLI